MFRRKKAKEPSQVKDDDSEGSKPKRISKKDSQSVISDISHSDSEGSVEVLHIPEAIKEVEENDVESLDMLSPREKIKETKKKVTKQPKAATKKKKKGKATEINSSGSYVNVPESNALQAIEPLEDDEQPKTNSKKKKKKKVLDADSGLSASESSVMESRGAQSGDVEEEKSTRSARSGVKKTKGKVEKRKKKTNDALSSNDNDTKTGMEDGSIRSTRSRSRSRSRSKRGTGKLGKEGSKRGGRKIDKDMTKKKKKQPTDAADNNEAETLSQDDDILDSPGGIISEHNSVSQAKSAQKADLIAEKERLSVEAASLRYQLREAEQSLHSLKGERSQYTRAGTEYTQMQMSLRRAKTEVSDLKSEVEEYEEAVAEKDGLIKKLTEAVDCQLDKVEYLELKLQRAEEEFCKMEDEMKEMEDEIEAIKSENETVSRLGSMPGSVDSMPPDSAHSAGTLESSSLKEVADDMQKRLLEDKLKRLDIREMELEDRENDLFDREHEIVERERDVQEREQEILDRAEDSLNAELDQIRMKELRLSEHERELRELEQRLAEEQVHQRKQEYELLEKARTEAFGREHEIENKKLKEETESQSLLISEMQEKLDALVREKVKSDKRTTNRDGTGPSDLSQELEAQLQEYKDENATLKEKNERLLREAADRAFLDDELQQQRDEELRTIQVGINKQLQELDDENKELQREIVALRSSSGVGEVSSSNLGSTASSHQVLEFQEEIADLREKIVEKEQHYRRQRQEIDRVFTENEIARKEMKELEASMQDLKDQLAETRQTAAKKMSQKDETISFMQNEMMRIMKEKQDVDRELRARNLEEKQSELMKIKENDPMAEAIPMIDLSAINTQLRQMDHENRELEERLKESEYGSSMKLKKQEGRILELEEELADLNWELKARKEADYVTLLKDRKERRLELDRAKKGLKKKAEQCEDLEKQISDLKQSQSNLQVDLEELNNSLLLRDSDDYVSDLQQQIRSLKAHSTTLETKLELEESNAKELSRKKDEQIATLVQELTTYKNPTSVRGIFKTFGRKSDRNNFDRSDSGDGASTDGSEKEFLKTTRDAEHNSLDGDDTTYKNPAQTSVRGIFKTFGRKSDIDRSDSGDWASTDGSEKEVEKTTKDSEHNSQDGDDPPKEDSKATNRKAGMAGLWSKIASPLGGGVKSKPSATRTEWEKKNARQEPQEPINEKVDSDDEAIDGQPEARIVHHHKEEHDIEDELKVIEKEMSDSMSMLAAHLRPGFGQKGEDVLSPPKPEGSDGDGDTDEKAHARMGSIDEMLEESGNALELNAQYSNGQTEEPGERHLGDSHDDDETEGSQLGEEHSVRDSPEDLEEPAGENIAAGQSDRDQIEEEQHKVGDSHDGSEEPVFEITQPCQDDDGGQAQQEKDTLDDAIHEEASSYKHQTRGEGHDEESVETEHGVEREFFADAEKKEDVCSNAEDSRELIDSASSRRFESKTENINVSKTASDEEGINDACAVGQAAEDPSIASGEDRVEDGEEAVVEKGKPCTASDSSHEAYEQSDVSCDREEAVLENGVQEGGEEDHETVSIGDSGTASVDTDDASESETENTEESADETKKEVVFV